MRFPGRSSKTTPTPAVPSILTLFPVLDDTVLEKAPVTHRADNCVGYGLEVVPIERCNTSCGKTVSPDTPEKEVLYATLTDWNRRSKPLPPLPNAAWKVLVKRKWYRLPSNAKNSDHFHADRASQVQLGLLLTICLGLLSVKPRLAKREPSEQSSDVATSPIRPSSPSIPLDTFSLNLSTPRQQSSACLSDSDDADAWPCTSQAKLHISVSSSERPLSQLELTIQKTSGTGTSSYGQQFPPTISAEFDPIYPMNDSDEEVIWHFQASYDRIVLLANDELSFHGQPQHEAERETSGKISPNDSPWVCYFNNTIMEVFVYASQRAGTATNSTQGANNTTETSSLPAFPFVIQIFEQWIQNGTRAYCEQQKVSEWGALRKSDAPRYFLSTTDATSVYASSIDKKTKQQAGVSDSACQCQWIVQ
ncbi:glucan 4-alpha-glucosidase [Paraphaeosphaeria sporulosa]